MINVQKSRAIVLNRSISDYNTNGSIHLALEQLLYRKHSVDCLTAEALAWNRQFGSAN